MHSWARELSIEARKQAINTINTNPYKHNSQYNSSSNDSDNDIDNQPLLTANTDNNNNNNNNRDSELDLLVEHYGLNDRQRHSGPNTVIMSDSDSTDNTDNTNNQSRLIHRNNNNTNRSNNTAANNNNNNNNHNSNNNTTTVTAPPTLKYRCNEFDLVNTNKFIELSADSSTLLFLSECTAQYISCCSYNRIATTILKPLLKCIFTHTSLNAVLFTGEMFLLSTEQFKLLYNNSFTAANNTNQPLYNTLLDVGAGSGNITKHISILFDSTTATDINLLMCYRLKYQRGYHSINTGELSTIPAHLKYDCILCFNVLDRCINPITLLESLKSRLLSQNSRLFLATPLPLDPIVESNNGKWIKPTQIVINHPRACCDSWELNANRLIEYIESNIGLIVLSYSRLPYISAGDSIKPFYLLDDIILVLALPQKQQQQQQQQQDSMPVLI